LAYINYLNSHKLFTKAAAVYAKAQQDVQNKESFEHKYQQQKNSQSTAERSVLGDQIDSESDTEMITTSE
jgi:hypothetical protein